MLQFGSKHVGIEDVHIFKHCHEMTGLLLWIGTYCISCVVQQTSRVKDLSSLVRYDDSCACSKYHTRITSTPKYTLPQRLVSNGYNIVPTYQRCVALKIVVVNRPV